MFNCSIMLFPRLVLIVPLKQSNDVTETKFPTFALYFMFQLVLNNIPYVRQRYPNVKH